MSGTAFRGVSAEQDNRFGNKEKQLLKKMTFPKEYSEKADLTRVNWEAMKPWIAKRITELLGGVEDDVLIGYIYGQVEGHKTVDPRVLQINLTGFLEKNTSLFCKELWALLVSASRSHSGIPQQFLDEKAAELRAREAERQAMQQRLAAERQRQEALRAEQQAAAQQELEARQRQLREAARGRDRSRSRSRSRKRGERRRRSSRSRSRDRDRHSRRKHHHKHRRERSRSRSAQDRSRRRRHSRSGSRERRRDGGGGGRRHTPPPPPLPRNDPQPDGAPPPLPDVSPSMEAEQQCVEEELRQKAREALAGRAAPT